MKPRALYAFLAIILLSSVSGCATQAPQVSSNASSQFEVVDTTIQEYKAASVSLEDIVLLAQNDISDETIAAYLKSRKLAFSLDAQALLSLREAGLDEELIQNMLGRQLPLEDSSALNAIVVTDYSSGYSAINYPSYYYMSGYRSDTLYPAGWYYSSYYPYYSGYGHGGSYPHYLYKPHNMHRNKGSHGRGGHGGAIGNHSGQQHAVSAGHSSSLSGGHSIGYSSGHSGGYGGVHSGGHR